MQRTFHLKKNNFFHLSWYGLNVTLTSLYFAHTCTKHTPPALGWWEVKPYSTKTTWRTYIWFQLLIRKRWQRDIYTCTYIRALLERSSMSQHVDGFHTPINHPTSGGQAQRQLLSKPFHLERSSFFYLPTLMVKTQRRAY